MESDMGKNSDSFFGTDGIRGQVGTSPITVDFILQLGWAVGSLLKERGGSKVVIGKDTRISGYMIESALEAGLSAAGIESYLLGPMPTPAIAHLTQALRTDLGIVISASHNPYNDNGVKFFLPTGFKISKEFEDEIVARHKQPIETASTTHVGRARRLPDVAGRYIEFCKSSLPHRTHFRKIKLVIDCANGATYRTAPEVFKELGAEVIAINVSPTGLNINEQCGSTHPNILRAHVLAEKADVGIALDGDGDRLVMVDHTGEILDGDELLYIITKGLLGSDYFSGGVVGTVMSNRGLELAINKMGLAFERVPVGDQHIIRALEKNNWILGGEPSGHITYLHVNTTADGIIAALQVLQAINSSGKSLHELKQGMTLFPQRLVSVPVKDKSLDLENGLIKKAVEDAKIRLGKDSSVLVRYSGTEPVLRIMVEGENKDTVNEVVHELTELVKR
jgi:phosphoglucosamine mutase